ncbi:MAG TPA: hypothetical protein O0X32_02715, partial [Methanocorpusculum sp.]|nr:hypothetical protein [Methanocorpusculum sp.]
MRTKNIFCILLAFILLACVCIGTAAADGTTIVQGEKYSLTGTAIGSPGSIQWYLFGPNYFKTGTSSVMDDSTYELSLSKDETKNMATGQYYLIIQHPMYDKIFNIGPVKTGNGYVIKQNTNGPYTDSSATVLFNVNERQSANGVNALMSAMGSQNIDDVFTQTTLTVNAAASGITTPHSIYEGGMYTVSGSTTGHVNDMVTVELIGGGFTPSTKQEQMSTEQYRISSTRIGESGLWTVNVDTTGLAPEEYMVKVTVGQLNPYFSTVTV